MRHFLERCGYHPIICSNGQSALSVAQSPEAPAIVILDWMMPGMDGLAVCRALRSSKLKYRPYVILFSTKTDKSEIAEGLDAGADDFVSKPFNVPEMQARLRVACRSVDYQRELQDRIDEVEALSQRNALLSELISKNRDEKPAPAANGTAHPVPHPAAPAPARTKSPGELSTNETRFIVSAALLELHLALESMQAHSGHVDTESPGCYAWTSLVLHSNGAWTDLLIATTVPHASTLFDKTFARRSRSVGDILVYLSEIARTIAGGFVRTLSRRAGEAHQPLMARAFHADSIRASLPLPIDAQAFDLSVDGCPLRLTLSTHRSAKLNLAPAKLQPMDILADNFPPAAVSQVPLLRAGAVLTPRIIEKIAFETETVDESQHADVYRPSPLAKYFVQHAKSA